MSYVYNAAVTTGGTTNTVWPLNITNTGYVYGGAGSGYSMPVPRPQSALEWLDAEVEATCRLARQAG